MKRRIGMLLVLLTTAMGAMAQEVSISNASDWQAFAERVNEGEGNLNATLTKDVDLGDCQVMVGTSENRFHGRFNGNGHTLTVHYTATEAICAPFRYVSGVDIFALHVAGTIDTAFPYAAGIIGNTSADDNTIFNCRSSIVITSSVNGTGNHGGLVGEARSDISITDCLFDGCIQTTDGTTDCAGFVGNSHNGSRIPIRNCLYAPTSTGMTSGKTLVRNEYDNALGVFNCYYIQTLGTAQGTDASGMSATELVAQLGAMWEVADGKVMPIIGQRPLSGSGTESAPYTIASVTDWHHFCTNVANGETYNGKYLKMTQDIDLGDLQAMVGTPDQQFLNSDDNTTMAFEGTFDGDGHTLTVAYNSHDIYCGPFRFIKGATVKNLNTTGTIETDSRRAAGVVAMTDYSSTTSKVQDCRSSIVITSSVNGTGTHGGIVAYVDRATELAVSDCLFDGKFLTTNGTIDCGGIVGYFNWALTLENCVFAPKAPADGETTVTSGYTMTSVGNSNNLTIRNCYYGTKMSTLQGKPVATSIYGDEGVTVSIQSTPIITLFDQSFYFSGTEVKLSYNGSEPFSRYKASTGAMSNSYTPTGTHTLDNIVGDVMISMTNECGDREMYLAYDDAVVTYYYDDQRSLRAITFEPTTPDRTCPLIPDGCNIPVKVVIDASFADARPTIETRGMFTFGWTSADNNVEVIEGLEYLNTSEAIDFTGMFYNVNVTNLDLSNFDTHKVVNMSRMFGSSDRLEYITFGPNFNTQQVTDMSYMFNDCTALKCLDLSTFETPNVINTAYMFGNCGELTTVCVDGTKWDMSNMVEDESFDHMLTQCRKIVGGKGTSWADKKDWGVDYAKIDGGSDSPGYFWDVNDTNLAKQAYAVFNSNDKKMSFHNDKWRNVTTGDNLTCYALGTDEKPTWFNLLRDDAIEKVEILPDFADVRPTTTQMWFGCMKLTEIKGLKYLDTSEVTTMRNMFGGCKLLTSLDVSGFDTHNVTSMFAMFSGCKGLTSLDLSNFNTGNVTDMYSMFADCSGLTSLDLNNFNTGKVTDMTSMFARCSNLTSLDLSNFNTANVTDMKSMFSECTNLKRVDLSSFDTRKVTSLQDLFYECNSLETLDLRSFNTSRVESLYRTFYGCHSLKSLDLRSFNTANVTNMYSTFYGCSSLEEIDLSSFNTSNVSTMTRLFFMCSSLKTLDLSSFNTANVTSMNEMFYQCSDLQTIYVTDNFVTTGLGTGDSNSRNMFQYCNSIVGGEGTTYQGDSFQYHGYAHIDGGDSNKGYFTSIYVLGYAVYDANTCTMTFYGDRKREEHTEGTTYGLNESWYDDLHFNVKKVVFDPSFAKARPQSMAGWFTDFFALSEIDGWENINTSLTTNMQELFFDCRYLTTLDMSHFDMSKVTNRNNMLKGLQSDILLYLPSGMKTSDFAGETNGNLTHEDYNLVLDEDGDGQYNCADLRLVDIKNYQTQGSSPDPMSVYYHIETPFHATAVTYQRSFTNRGTTTLYLPFSINTTGFGALYSYEGAFTGSKNGIRVYPVEAGSTTPNTPYVLVSNGEPITAEDVDVLATQDTEVMGADEMIGTHRVGMVPQGAYTLDESDGTLKRVKNNNVKTSAFRAYFMLPTANEADQLIISFGDDGISTGNMSVKNAETFSDQEVWYTLDGRRLTSRPTKRGLYIVNGRKHVIKH